MLIINKSGIEIPDFLDKKFFRDTLEDGFRESGIELNQISFEMGSNAGDNYCSSIYRVRVNFHRRDVAIPEDISIIVKTIPITSGTQFLDDVGVFMKEKSVYIDVLPRLEILLDDVKLGAKMFYALKEPIQTIVFDDLVPHGFKTASRQDGLDINHCRLLLQRLGQLHASSMVLLKKDPEIRSKFQQGMLSKATVQQTDTFDKMFGGNLGQLAKLVSGWPGYEKIAAKLNKHRANFKTDTVLFASPKPGEITVLNHGDLWVSNFMYSYDKENPSVPNNVIFIDFQLSFFGSPACDINFFLNTSVQYDILVNQRDELIGFYYDSFAGTLKSLNYSEIPTMDDLKRDLRARETYGLFGLYAFLPMITMDKDHSEGSSIDAMSNEEENKAKLEKIFANEKLHKFFRHSLTRFEELGVLDELGKE